MLPLMMMIPDTPLSRPAIVLLAGHSKRLRGGHPWVFSNELRMDPETKALPAGSLVTVIDAGGERLGVGSFNPHSLIAVRMLDRNADQAIDQSWITARLQRALRLRDQMIGAPYYRLIHAEADGLPGLIIDRYGDVLSIQANTAGMEVLTPLVLEGLLSLLTPRALVLKNDSPVRKLEGLETYEKIAHGALSGPVPLIENGVTFFADLVDGQKTGWFYDQRDNRAAIAALAKGRSVIDFYTYAGGFAIQAAKAGARSVVAVDRSEGSLALASQAAAANGVTIDPVRADCFAEMERLAAAGSRFEIVVADPPAFVKSRKDIAAGSKGYRKMAKLAAALVAPEGFLLAGSCSHHMTPDAFAEAIRQGIQQAGRSGRIVRTAGAGADHPVHPFLPESAYLKALLFQLD